MPNQWHRLEITANESRVIVRIDDKIAVEVSDGTGAAELQIAPVAVDHHLAPTVVIGVGGSGKDVLLRVRRMFYERLGNTGYPIISYLARAITVADRRLGRDATT